MVSPKNSMIKNLTILMILMAVVSISSTLISINKFMSNKQNYNDYKTVVKLNEQLLEARRQEKNFQLRGFEVYKGDKKNAVEKWQDCVNNIYSDIDKEQNPSNQAYLQELLAFCKKYEKTFHEITASGKDILSSDNPLNDTLVTSARDFHNKCKAITDIYDQKATKAMIDIITLLVSVCGFTLAFYIGVIFYVRRTILRKLLHSVIDIKDSIEQISHASAQVSVSSQNLAHGASEQASSLEESNANITEMSDMIRDNASNTAAANALAGEATMASGNSIGAMEQMNTAISKIKHSSEEISKIISVIDSIAFQTNLLALNASVEAARAGEAGKGFAVVAEEVRNLSMRCAEAAKSTSQMLGEAKSNADHGFTICQNVDQSLVNISKIITNMAELLSKIDTSCQSQATNISHINQAISNIDTITQANAVSSEEGASASEELSSQAEHVNSMVNALTRLIAGADKVNTSYNYIPETSTKSNDDFFHYIADSKTKAKHEVA